MIDKIISIITQYFPSLREKNRSIIISYLTLRKLIGILGMLLPIICIIGGLIFWEFSIQRSISYYYHTNMRDFFVGLLFCVSMFLITYRGYEKIDDIITTVSGIASWFIAFFPCSFDGDSSRLVSIIQIKSCISNKIHLTSASIFFFLLAINSIFLFTLSDKPQSEISEGKKFRNKIYIGCGIAILLSLVFIPVLYIVLGEERIVQYKIILIFEAIMLVAFGISWLVKGRTLFQD